MPFPDYDAKNVANLVAGLKRSDAAEEFEMLEARRPEYIDAVQVQLPRYRCHKEVWALKIRSVVHDGARRLDPDADAAVPGATLRFEETRYGTLYVDGDYVAKHNPQAGGYYVVYRDGYKSWSPAKEFEDGYTLIF